MLISIIPGVGMGGGQVVVAGVTPPYFKRRHGGSARYYIPYCLAVLLCW